MTTRPLSPAQHEPELPGQTVIVTGRNPGQLQHKAAELGAVRSGWPLA